MDCCNIPSCNWDYSLISKPIWSALVELQTLKVQNNYQDKIMNADAETVKELVKSYLNLTRIDQPIRKKNMAEIRRKLGY